MNRSIRILLFGCLTVLLSTSCPAAENAQSGKHLFILSGQSNMTDGLEKGFTEVVTGALGKDRVTVVRHCKPGRGIRFWVEDYELPEGHPLHGKLKAGNGEEFPKLLAAARSAGDAKSFDTNRNLAVAYAKSFAALLTRLKSGLGIAKMHIVIGRISDHGLHGESTEGWKAMRAVQMEIADSDPLGAWIDTDDLNGGDEKNPQGDLHYPNDQYSKLGARLAEAALKQLRDSTIRK